jgi:hypothetical protein
LARILEIENAETFGSSESFVVCDLGFGVITELLGTGFSNSTFGSSTFLISIFLLP